MPPRDFVLFQNIDLTDADTGGQTSTVGEPSLANNGQQLLLTGNWYATRSLDHGATWDHISPFNFFPPAAGGFCCDQTVIYDHSRDLTLWILQYIQQNNTNTLRLAVKTGPSLGNNIWHWWDFEPRGVNADWQNEWFDYNHAALSNDFLYVGSNAFRTMDNQWTRALVMRFPLDDLAAGAGLDYSYFTSTQNFSLRCVQGAREVMYFASHNSNQQLRVFTWPENSNTVNWVDVNVTPWRGGLYSAPGPDGNDWLRRCDARITGAWVANGVIGLMWSANSMEPVRPYPYVRVVRLNDTDKQVLDEPDIWNPNVAYAYPDACANDRGHVGITLFRGGGNQHPGHVVGIWDDYSNGWELRATRNGSNAPADQKWGDYLTCRRHSPDGLTWVAAGFTLQGGSSLNHLEPRVVHFGRERDRAAVRRWQST